LGAPDKKVLIDGALLHAGPGVDDWGEQGIALLRFPLPLPWRELGDCWRMMSACLFSTRPSAIPQGLLSASRWRQPSARDGSGSG